jgi:hypothetical protein
MTAHIARLRFADSYVLHLSLTSIVADRIPSTRTLHIYMSSIQSSDAYPSLCGCSPLSPVRCVTPPQPFLICVLIIIIIWFLSVVVW